MHRRFCWKALRSILLFGALFFSLTACRAADYTVPYLLAHPAILSDASRACLASKVFSNEEARRCVIVFAAEARMKFYLEEEQMNPQKFGASILAFQMQQAAAKERVMRATERLAALTSAHASSEALAAAKKELEIARTDYERATDTVNTVLAIAGLESPE